MTQLKSKGNAIIPAKIISNKFLEVENIKKVRYLKFLLKRINLRKETNAADLLRTSFY